MHLDTIGDKLTALFIIISDTDDTFNFLVAMMYSQLFNLLCTKADNNPNGSGRLKYPVRCLIDEFANIKQIPQFEKIISVIRSRGISASIILQTKSPRLLITEKSSKLRYRLIFANSSIRQPRVSNRPRLLSAFVHSKLNNCEYIIATRKLKVSSVSEIMMNRAVSLSPIVSRCISS